VIPNDDAWRYATPKYNLKKPLASRPKYPAPNGDWQMEEYRQSTGQDPPPERDDWQWRYNPRTKESKQRMEEFLDAES
jgi:hypothetical protein